MWWLRVTALAEMSGIECQGHCVPEERTHIFVNLCTSVTSSVKCGSKAPATQAWEGEIVRISAKQAA